MLDRLKQWNDRQREQARHRMEKNSAVLRGRPVNVSADGQPVDMRAWVKAHKRNRIGHLAGVHLFADKIVRLDPWPTPGGEEHPVAGVSATVDNTGGVSGRSTLTRSLVPGMHGWQKEVDTRETWLVVDGPDFQWSVKVGQLEVPQARQFAAAVTSAGRRAAAAE